MQLGQYTQGRDNNYNLIRHLAAAAVLLTHSYGLLDHSGEEPLLAATGQSFSYLAVNIFFVLSGFLITASWLNRARTADFLAARLARIGPALWMSVALCMFVVGPAFTTLPLREYFLHRDLYIFGAENSTLILNGIYHYLPGVFEDLPHARYVNESLWTLPYELEMYICVWLLGLVGILRFPAVVILLYAVLLPLHLASAWFGTIDVGNKELVRLASYFSAGAAYYMLRDRIPLNGRFALLLAALVIVAYGIDENAGTAILALASPYILFAAAYLPGGLIRQFNRLGDYSYGIYVYSFPVQQMLVAAGIRELLPHLALSYLLTLVLAICSWHLLETRVLQHRHWLADRLRGLQLRLGRLPGRE